LSSWDSQTSFPFLFLPCFSVSTAKQGLCVLTNHIQKNLKAISEHIPALGQWPGRLLER
jgi:hypothetical protein